MLLFVLSGFFIEEKKNLTFFGHFSFRSGNDFDKSPPQISQHAEVLYQSWKNNEGGSQSNPSSSSSPAGASSASSK